MARTESQTCGAHAAPTPATRLARWASRTTLAALLLDRLVTSRRRQDQAAQLRALTLELAAQRRQSEELAAELRAEARTDPLTGVGNRRRWQEQLVHELERAERTGTPVAVALVDLDHFKDVNDALGHAAGDELLRRTAAGFLECVRTVDLVARLGGDEFAVALPDVSLVGALAVVERLRTSTPAPVTASAGLVQWDGQEGPGELLRRADAALYRAKAEGRDGLVVG